MKLALLGVATATALVACGGGSSKSATEISGIAAAGAPIIGTVTIKDSTTPTAQTKTVPIEANGKYTVNVAGMKAPFMVRADGYVGGNQYHLYSAGTTADVGGNINITPLTDLIVANIAGSIAKTYFDNGSFSNLTASELTTQADALKAKLLPVLQTVGVGASIDLLRDSFSADHTGLDAALDVLKVTTDTDTGVATITNVITQQQMTSDLATGTYTGAITDTTGVAAGVTDVQAISDLFKRFSALFATSLPSETNATLLGMFDADFLNDGEDLQTFLSDLTTDLSMVGISFSNITLQSIDTEAGTAVVGFTVVQDGKPQTDGPRPFHMIKENGSWRMLGDQYLAHVRIRPLAQYQPSGGSDQITTGLHIDIEDRGGRGFTSAVISGKGFPGPVTMVSQINNEWFTFQGDYSDNTYHMTDSQVAAIADGESYTVQLYVGSVLTATYTETVAKRPYLSTELNAAMFPSIDAPTVAALRAFGGGAVTVNWTLPDGLSNEWLELALSDANGSNTARAEYSPRPTDRTHAFDLPATTNGGVNFTPASRMVWLNASDSYGRQLSTGIW